MSILRCNCWKYLKFNSSMLILPNSVLDLPIVPDLLGTQLSGVAAQ